MLSLSWRLILRVRTMFRAPKPAGKKSEATADIKDKFVHLDPANTYQDISRRIAHVRKNTLDEVDAQNRQYIHQEADTNALMVDEQMGALESIH